MPGYEEQERGGAKKLQLLAKKWLSWLTLINIFKFQNNLVYKVNRAGNQNHKQLAL